MGNLKVNDLVIIQEILCINGNHSDKYIGKVGVIVKIDDYVGYNNHVRFPYKVLINGEYFWIEGIPYNKLMMELL